MKIKRLDVILSAAKNLLSETKDLLLVLAQDKLRSEKGFVLILALVSMVAMTVIGISLITNMTTDMQLARNEREAKLAFQLADAGINETMARFRLNAAAASYNPNYVGELAPPGGTTDVRTALLTTWPGNGAGVAFDGLDGFDCDVNPLTCYRVSVTYLIEGLPYCDSNTVAPNSTGNMTVDAITGVPSQTAQNCNSEVVMYGRDFNLAQTVTSIKIGKYPVYRVVSTGRSGTTERQIEAYVGASSLNTDTGTGILTNNCVNNSGTPPDVISDVTQPASCTCDPTFITCPATPLPAANTMETYLGGDALSDIAALATQSLSCSTGPTCNAISGSVTDWGDVAGNTNSTIIYINNGVTGATPVSINGLMGRGILVITGDLELSGNITYEGLIFVVGTITSGGSGSGAGVTGGVMSGGLISINGGLDVTYDLETLMAVSRQNSSKSLIVWRRL